jgi:hypothetical protein
MPDPDTTARPAPLSDDDTFDVLDEAVTTLAQRRRLSLGDEHDQIHLLASLIEQAERCLPEAVATARANDTSWADIARLLGTNLPEAWMRYDPDSPIADGRWPYNY